MQLIYYKNGAISRVSETNCKVSRVIHPSGVVIMDNRAGANKLINPTHADVLAGKASLWHFLNAQNRQI